MDIKLNSECLKNSWTKVLYTGPRDLRKHCSEEDYQNLWKKPEGDLFLVRLPGKSKMY